MAPTILVVGATGNTGRSVVETLSKFLNSSDNTTLPGHQVIALTRSLKNPVAQHLATLPGVQVLELNWVDITADWLREHQVVRAFMASAVQPTQFAEESSFHVAALRAGVQYVVRISTTAPNVRPDFPAFYPRQHWALETMLGSPEFAGLQWTSLQPNIFTNFHLQATIEWIKQVRKTGKQDTPLRLLAAKDVPVGVIHPDDIGELAAKLLVQRDTSVHNKAKYVLNGPEDVTGEQIVQLVEQHIGARVENVVYKDLSMIDGMAAAAEAAGQSKSLYLSIKHAPVTAWEGLCTAATTSKEVLELSPPTRTLAGAFKELLEEEA